MNTLNVKRIYADREESDGYRILIDRIWPRGIKKEVAALDEWAKQVAPSSELRKWFGHKEENFERFKERYELELDNNPEATALAQHCSELLTKKNVTLLYGARSATCNNAIILRDWLLGKMK
ncbi:MAG: DUF488 domain-containing protein [Fermentimonas sp.]|jgi:uncharacterized protein YeaO (DUF488 family)